MSRQVGGVLRLFVNFLLAVSLLTTLAFVSLRFMRLDADLPVGMNRSKMLFTDEGWYASGAIRHYFTGQWYADTDFNPIVVMPVGQILHRASFAVFGMSLFSARLTTVLSFVGSLAALAELARRTAGYRAAVFVALVLAVNPFTFAFSRLALQEFPGLFFGLAALLVLSSRRIAQGWRVSFAVLLQVAAMLTKATLIFVLPALVVAILTTSDTPSRASEIGGEPERISGPWHSRRKILLAVGFVLATLFFFFAYQSLVARVFPFDVELFREINVTARVHHTPAAWALDLKNFSTDAVRASWLVVSLPVLMATTWLVLPASRRDPILGALGVAAIAGSALLSLSSYHPTRYFVPVTALAGYFFGLTLAGVVEQIETGRRDSRARFVVGTVVGFTLLAHDGIESVRGIFSTPRSMEGLAASVRSTILADGGALGANPIYTSVPTLNLSLGVVGHSLTNNPRGMHAIGKVAPRYIVTLGDGAIDQVRRRGGVVTRLGEWRIFREHYPKERPIVLSRVRWPESP